MQGLPSCRGENYQTSIPAWASLVAQTVKHLPTTRETWLRSWVGKILWRRKWQPTPVLLPGKSHGQRSLVGYSPQGHKESDTTEQLHFQLHFHRYGCESWTIKKAKSEVLQSCPTLCDPMDCSLSGFSVRGIFQARVLEFQL